MADLIGAAASVPAAPCAALSTNYIPPIVFRERILQLANEYDLMHASLDSLLGGGGDALPDHSDDSSMCDADAPMKEGRPMKPNVLRVRQPGAGADEAKPVHAGLSVASSVSDVFSPVMSVSSRPSLQCSVGHMESEHVYNVPDMESRPSALRRRKKSVIRSERPQHDWKTSPFSWLAHSSRFERFIGVIIVMNVAFLGVSTESAMSDARGMTPGKTHMLFQAIEAGFLLIYALELMIRLAAFGKGYFTDESERFWNLFDMALVFQIVFEQVSTAANIGVGTGNLSFLRGLRLLKSLKMLRVVRLLRSMRELRMILSAVMGSLTSMMWSLLLLVTVLYMFALICLQGMIAYLEISGDIVKDDVYEGIMAYWGSVRTAMLTLFMCSTGGMDWVNAYNALSHAGPFFRLVFLAYMSFFMFVISNAITSLFVEATLERAARDLYGRVQSELQKKQEYVKNLNVLFEEMDEGKGGLLSLEEFERQVQDPKMVGFLASLDITIRDAARFFNMLSEGGTKTVNLEQFVTACVRMHGPAQAVDVYEIMIQQSMMHEMICDLKTSLNPQSL